MALSRNVYVEGRAAAALASSGDLSRAANLADDLRKRFPLSTWVNGCFLPDTYAAIEIQKSSATRAVERLQSTSSCPLLGIIYRRGTVYLGAREGVQAAAEFQKILDHRGFDMLSSFYPLAYLGLARAYALQGDTTKSRTAYQDFFALWKDADPDIPILKDAKSEYAKLK